MLAFKNEAKNNNPENEELFVFVSPDVMRNHRHIRAKIKCYTGVTQKLGLHLSTLSLRTEICPAALSQTLMPEK